LGDELGGPLKGGGWDPYGGVSSLLLPEKAVSQGTGKNWVKV